MRNSRNNANAANTSFSRDFPFDLHRRMRFHSENCLAIRKTHFLAQKDTPQRLEEGF